MADLLNRSYKNDVAKKYTILYVDDEEVNLRVFNRNFNKFYNVITAIDAFEAQNLLASNSVDLIMTDQCMPRMNGSELLMKIVPQYPDIIRMIMTGFSDEQDISDVKEKVGLHKFLKKPWDPTRLKTEFDEALEKRAQALQKKKQVKAASEKKSKPVPQEEVDLLESTMSLVEGDSKQLKAEINDLVKDAKSKRSEFMDSGINYLLNLKDSMLPMQQEIKLFTDDAFIIYDKNIVNKNGYWFGEVDDRVVIASYHSNTHVRESLSLNSFVSAMLNEIVYKEHCTETDEIIKNLSHKVLTRFVGKNKENTCPLEIAVLVYDKNTDKVAHSGAHHDLFFLNENNEFKVLMGNQEVMVPGKTIEYDINVIGAGDANALYMVPFNVIEETNDKKEDTEALKMLLGEVYKLPFGMQSKMFKDYGYSSVIGLKF
ncbi:response regulator [Reichenbachiella ulvae]|uniref:Response regulator n=1 Tax=Reichenbachiella ulvae TaxID=2980104 RepID=A0ABT3CPJ6_9BACT|nr:response regulator [Reichenbachiella ulvae]MCV9385630.1 response regulator [Reichenbachiella ulvae]